MSHIKVVSSYPQMPSIYETIPAETLEAMELAIEESEDKHIGRWSQEFITMFHQFRLYQNNRLKINKESREGKMAARKEGGGAKKGSAKMTGVVKLVAIEGQENTYKVEKVSIPVPAPAPVAPEEEDAEPLSAVAKRVEKRLATKPKTPEPEPEAEEEDISNNPEALAAAMAEAAERAATPSPNKRKTKKQQREEEEEAEQRADSKTGRTINEVAADCALARGDPIPSWSVPKPKRSLKIKTKKNEEVAAAAAVEECD